MTHTSTLSDARWTEADAHRLCALMQQKGWDAVRLAQWAALSRRQVQELCAQECCEGAGGAFYSESIKRHAGQRLIERLRQTQPAA